MEMQELTVTLRDGKGKQAAKRLRREGRVPAVLYGGTAPQDISVDPKAVLKMIHGHEGSTQLLSLKVDGSAGGVRIAVGSGRGVSLGMEVAVGCNCANAVSTARVRAALISGVGGDACGVHAARITASMTRLVTNRNIFCMRMILSEKDETAVQLPSHHS